MGGVAKAIGGLFGATSDYQAQGPGVINQTDLLDQIKLAQGNLAGVQGNQGALAQALMAQSQGQGPNPAQMLMKQSQDRANQQGAGMLASARGVNPALAARLAAQQSAQGNQMATQNAGILGAQQQLSAQNQLGGLYGQMGQQALNQNQIAQSALSGQNQAAMQTQQINAGIAGQNAQANAQLMGGLIGGVASAGTAAALRKHSGGHIGGEAKVAGDSPANDTVPAMLSPGEIVIPRSAAGDVSSAKAFIEHLMRDKKKKRKAS